MKTLILLGLPALALAGCTTVETGQPVDIDPIVVGCAVAPSVFPDFAVEIAQICALNAAAQFTAAALEAD